MKIKHVLWAVAVALLIGLFDNAYSIEEYNDIRYCGPPARHAVTNRILRDGKQKYLFRKHNPCPANGSLHGACPGWSVDHIRPLASCGCDNYNNMQWLNNDIKTCAGICKDRWERWVYICKPEDM